ncbi:SIS domain-containing protein [Bacillus subtilis]|uniref:SIS domain-containing protein n=1 Tax=Bacillus subtilis TaxID=1423 RepID=UPI00397F9550
MSYTGETTNILKLLPMIRKKKATIISLTSIGDNTLVKQSDYLFRITTREKLYSKIGNFTLNNSITFLLDIFYSCIFSEAYKDNIEFKVNISKYYDSRKSSNKVMREEE